jgi:hypothetical protein
VKHFVSVEFVKIGWCNGSIPGADPGGNGSSPFPMTNVGFSLFGKASVCATEEQGSNPGVNPKREFVVSHDKYNSEMRKRRSASIGHQQKVLWQNGYMHRSEIPDIVVQFHGAPQGRNS